MNSSGWIDEALTAQIPCAVTNDDNPHAGSVTPPSCANTLYTGTTISIQLLLSQTVNSVHICSWYTSHSHITRL